MTTIKIETDDGSIESIVNRIKRRRLVKTDDGKFEIVAKAEKTASKDKPKDETKTEDSIHGAEQRHEVLQDQKVQGATKASDLTKQLELVDTGVDDSKKFDLQNFGNTNFHVIHQYILMDLKVVVKHIFYQQCCNMYLNMTYVVECFIFMLKMLIQQ